MEILVGKTTAVGIRAFNQELTYGGLLEGLPHDKLNARLLASAAKRAAHEFGIREVFVVEPAQIPIEYAGTYRLGKPQKLPEVLCMASMRSYQPARDQTADYSALVVVWFQEDFAFPIEATVLARLAELPWSKVAGDYYF